MNFWNGGTIGLVEMIQANENQFWNQVLAGKRRI